MMEQLPENSAVPNDGSVVTPAVSLGKTLREARERNGLSIADMAHQIKFAPRQIEALEADDFQYLPEMTFLRGFVRSYAKTLNLDVQPLLEALPQANVSAMPLTPISVEVPFPSASSPQLHNLIWLGAALLLAVLVVVFAVWHYTTPVTPPEMVRVETPVALPSSMKIIPASPVIEASAIASPVAPVTRPAAEAAQSVAAQSAVLAAKPSASQPRDALHATGEKLGNVPPTQPVKSAAQPATLPQPQPVKPATQPGPTQPVKSVTQSGTVPEAATLRLAFDDESWVEIRDKDGKIVSSQVNPSGSELRLNVAAPFSLVIGHAGKVRVYHRGKKVDLTDYINDTSDVARLTVE